MIQGHPLINFRLIWFRLYVSPGGVTCCLFRLFIYNMYFMGHRLTPNLLESDLSPPVYFNIHSYALISFCHISVPYVVGITFGAPLGPFLEHSPQKRSLKDLTRKRERRDLTYLQVYGYSFPQFSPLGLQIYWFPRLSPSPCTP